ncbi:spore coat protein [Marininema halotolerans]|uniref:Coat F domain-containing protein n=1 Tax=Marininema halotolerans TaxID=1155944 RepID=A0A1I6RLR5_9BACL|nr:spore coat protein [Marininema halotolerans]SFS65645.1 Coat F domain-containing protein [Marininema halotolerans]
MQPQNQGTPQASTGLPQVKGPEMNDRDRINDVLTTVKYLTDGYNIGVNEASNDRLYQTQMNILTNLHNCQRDLYHMMHSKGWYKTEPVEMQKVTTTFQQFSNYSTQFPY